MSYKVKRSLNCDLGKINVLQPDHVSLGKCVTCHQFIRQYATFYDTEVVNMLRDGCQFKGFKKIVIESTEEEGFANMHHVLLIESINTGETKEICTLRLNDFHVSQALLEKQVVVVAGANSVVAMMKNSTEKIDLYFFAKRKIITMTIPDRFSFEVCLLDDVMYIKDSNTIEFVNFFRKTVSSACPKDDVLLMTSELFVTKNKYDSLQHFDCEYIHRGTIQCVRYPEIDMKQHLLTSSTIVNVKGCILWTTFFDQTLFLYEIDNGELVLKEKFNFNKLNLGSLTYEQSKYCFCSNQLFLLLVKSSEEYTSSLIVVVDMLKFNIVCLLEMELTLNRKPKLKMCPSKNGSKLFIQERFENRVIFYQVFTLLPAELRLQNIIKSYIWNTFSEEWLKSVNIPKLLAESLLDGF